MAVTVLQAKQQKSTTGDVTIYEVPANKIARLNLRATNIHASADQTADVYIEDPVTGANSGYRARNHPIPFSQAGSSVDLERGLVLTEGLRLKVRGSANDAVGFSLTGTLRDE
jgi:hypothetical protein